MVSKDLRALCKLCEGLLTALPEKLPNMHRPQNLVNSLMPESSKLSKSIRPKEAQNNVCVVSHKLKLDRDGKHDFSVHCDMVIIYSILLGKFSEGKAMIDLYHNLIIVILICHLKGEIVILNNYSHTWV